MTIVMATMLLLTIPMTSRRIITMTNDHKKDQQDDHHLDPRYSALRLLHHNLAHLRGLTPPFPPKLLSSGTKVRQIWEWWGEWMPTDRSSQTSQFWHKGYWRSAVKRTYHTSHHTITYHTLDIFRLWSSEDLVWRTICNHLQHTTLLLIRWQDFLFHQLFEIMNTHLLINCGCDKNKR